MILFFSFCETTQNTRQPEQKTKLTPREKLAELSKAAVSIRIYSIIEADPSSKTNQPTYLPEGRASLRDLKSGKIYKSQISDDNINVFLDIPPGQYVIHDLHYDDPLSYIIANWFFKKLDDKSIKVAPEKVDHKHPLVFRVEPRKLQYGGDFSIVFSKSGTRAAPPDYENEEKDMKKTAEMILAKFPHSFWAKESLKILGIDNSF